MKTLLLLTALVSLSACSTKEVAQARAGLALADQVLTTLAAPPPAAVTSAKAVTTNPQP